ncbi:hypothetical protein BGZ58_004093, partial [Dissophora ornata]
QIIENFKIGSAASLSLPFLINWLLGDISNLIGCILTHQLPFQMYLAIYFCIADVILFGQWIYYSRQEHWRQSLPEITVADLPEIAETNSQQHRHHHHRQHRSRSRSQSRPYRSGQATSTGTINATSSTDQLLLRDETDLDVGISGDLESAAETFPPVQQRSRPRRLTTTSDIGHRRSTSMVLFGLVLLTMKQTLPALQEEQEFTGRNNYGDLGSDMPSIVGRVFARALEGDQGLGEMQSSPADRNIVQLGRIFAWVCTIFYLTSRMPQLWKNFKRKSVQGLSILMFFWAAMGNMSYTLSILNSADAINPETRKKFLREAVPYVLGSSGTLTFDLSIFFQWLYYTGKLRIFGIGRRHHHHRHRHRHHLSRQRDSRTLSRMDSMALSPSGSQAGLYTAYRALADDDDDEEDPDLLKDEDVLLSQSSRQSEEIHPHEGHDAEGHAHSLEMD